MLLVSHVLWVGTGWAAYVLYLEVDHPYAAADHTGTPGTYGDQQGRVYGVAGAKVSILTAFGQMGRGMIERHRTLAKEIRHSGAAGEPVWGETLALIGYNYAAQMAQADRLAARVGAVMQKTFSTGENLLMDLVVRRSVRGFSNKNSGCHVAMGEVRIDCRW